MRYPQLSMVTHACNSSTQEAKVVGSEFRASLDYIARLCHKKQRAGVVAQW
jgi:hypothetical protein